MLTIRDQQMETFHAVARTTFEHEMVAHLTGFAPFLASAAGMDQMRKAVRLGIARAGNYDLTSRGPVRLFLELTALFGSHFDTDPQYPWIKAILRSRESSTEMQRAEKLFAKTLEYRNQVVGPNEMFALDAIRNLQNLATRPSLFSGDLVTAMCREVTLVYPQRADYLGAETLDAVVRTSIKTARSYGFAAAPEIAPSVFLLLGFGHGCSADPLYPWIGEALTDPAIASPAARAKLLKREALNWVQRLLAYSDQVVQP